MRYIVVHTIASPMRERVQAVIDQIMERHDVFDMRGIDPHLTLKYFFDESHLPVIEEICLRVTRGPAPGFSLEGVGDFAQRVVFLEVRPSAELVSFLGRLHTELVAHDIPLEYDERDGVHLHVTLAQEVKPAEFPAVLQRATDAHLVSDLVLDTIEILSFDGEEFRPHKRYAFDA